MSLLRVFVALAVVGLFATVGMADEVRVSHCYRGDTAGAINDRIQPESPVDRPRHSFWPHHGTKEWVEYHFDAPQKVSSTRIYWLDDTPGGGCPVPESWRFFYRKGNEWLPVEGAGEFGVKKGQFNRVTFKPVETKSLRIEVKSRTGRMRPGQEEFLQTIRQAGGVAGVCRSVEDAQKLLEAA